MEIEPNDRGQKENRVNRVGKTLFVNDIFRLVIGLLNHSPVKLHLDFASDLHAVRVLSIQQEGTRSKPRRIEITQASLQGSVLYIDVIFPGSKNPTHVEQRGRANQQTQQEPEPWSHQDCISGHTSLSSRGFPVGSGAFEQAFHDIDHLVVDNSIAGDGFLQGNSNDKVV